MATQELALTADECAEFVLLENDVREGVVAFVKVGQALLTIRDKRLYRNEYGSFEAYCAGRWNITRRRAYQMIEATGVVENVNQWCTTAPENERQARPLAELPPEEQAPAWQEAVDTAPAGKVTAAHVADVVERRKPEPKRKPKPVATLYVCPFCREEYTDGTTECNCTEHEPEPEPELPIERHAPAHYTTDDVFAEELNHLCLAAAERFQVKGGDRFEHFADIADNLVTEWNLWRAETAKFHDVPLLK